MMGQPGKPETYPRGEVTVNDLRPKEGQTLRVYLARNAYDGFHAKKDNNDFMYASIVKFFREYLL